MLFIVLLFAPVFCQHECTDKVPDCIGCGDSCPSLSAGETCVQECQDGYSDDNDGNGAAVILVDEMAIYVLLLCS